MAGVPNVSTDNDYIAWLLGQADSLTESISVRRPSEFITEERVLPASVTATPGPMRFDTTPYIVEPLNMFDPDHPAKEVTIIKGVQVAATVGVLESIILYYACEVPQTPMQLISATSDLVKTRMESNILPMFQHSGLDDKIRSNDKTSTRKSGAKRARMDFANGSLLLLSGAQSGAALRSHSIRVSLRDEVDTFKSLVADGKIDELADGRQASYWEKRKTLRITTPLEKESSVGYEHWRKGDQRRYNVACKHCGKISPMRWRVVDKETGIIGGVIWQYDGNSVIKESVRYACPSCGHEHYEHDKPFMFSPENGAKWIATAKPTEKGLYSYHIPGMLSPTLPWSKLASDHAKAFLPDGKILDFESVKTFYNLGLGEPWKRRVNGKVTQQHARNLRRQGLLRGEINNEWHIANCGGQVELLIMAVDVHRHNLAITVYGILALGQLTLIDYWRLTPTEDSPDCTDPESSVWTQLTKLIEEKTYTADNGEQYRIMFTLIDAGFANATVVAFCGQYDTGVNYLLGRPDTPRGSRVKEFSEVVAKTGVPGYIVAVDTFKGTLDSNVRRHYDQSYGVPGTAPHGTINMPVDMTDDELKELTREILKTRDDGRGMVSYYWHRVGGTAAPNELWDLTVYTMAGVSIMGYNYCIRDMGLEVVDWPMFFDFVRGVRGNI